MRVGIYVDASNISLSGGYAMRYDILKEFILQGSEPTRLITYLAYDKERAKDDPIYRNRQQNYFSIIRGFGFKIVIKNIRRFKDEEGNEYTKANADLDMAIDHLQWCDYSYVCVPAGYYSIYPNDFYQNMKDKGIGIILATGTTFIEILRGYRNTYKAGKKRAVRDFVVNKLNQSEPVATGCYKTIYS